MKRCRDKTGNARTAASAPTNRLGITTRSAMLTGVAKSWGFAGPVTLNCIDARDATNTTQRAKIEEEIRVRGFFAYRVYGGPTPQWMYTIGLWETFKHPEIVIAGSAFLKADDLNSGLRTVTDRIREGEPVVVEGHLDIPAFGQVGFRPVHATWTEHLLLGALDYYGMESFEAVQIVPSEKYSTLDTPDLSRAYSANHDTAWSWLVAPWPYRVPDRALVMTEFKVLQGARVWFVDRDDAGDWQMFASRDLPPPVDTARIVPLATLFAIDPSLEEVCHLAPGQYAERGADGQWTTLRE